MPSGSSSGLKSQASGFQDFPAAQGESCGARRSERPRYRALARRLADNPGELHRLFIVAMISGDLTGWNNG